MKQLDLIVDYLRQEPLRSVKLLVRGNSMRPFLVHERDYVLLQGISVDTSTPQNAAAPICVGDIVLAEILPSKYVLHRLIKIDGAFSDPSHCHLTLRGDGNLTTELCLLSDLRGKVTGFLRKDRTEPEQTSSFRYRGYSWFWMHSMPIRRLLLKAHDICFHSVKDLNRITPTTEEIDAFLSLLRYSLWKEEVSTDALKDIHWQVIWHLAKKQTLLGQISEAIQALPQSIQEKAGGVKLTIKTLGNILRHNRDLNNVSYRIISFLQQKGFYPILLKGQGIASYYPEPLIRQGGDVDIYIGNKDFKRACSEIKELVGEEAYGNGDLQIKHFTVQYSPTVFVELHKLSCLETENLEKKWLTPSKYETIEIEGNYIPVPPLQFNIVYIFAHFWDHLIWEGAGLRQLCDWCYLLYRSMGKINLDQLKKDLISANLYKGWQIIGWIVVNKLGLPEDAMPFYSSEYEKSSKLAWKKILNGGNFGTYNESRVKREKKIWIVHKTTTAVIVTKYALESLRIAPKEVFHMYCLKIYKGVITHLMR